MKSKIPGGVIDSVVSKARYPKSVVRRLNYQRRKHGCIFWDYPLLRSSSRVLIVFDKEYAEAITTDDVLFAKASEYWKNRETSNDLYERLLGDSLYFSDGCHHQKRATDYKQRINSKGVTPRYIRALMSILAAIEYERGEYSRERLEKDLCRRFFEDYYNVVLTENSLELVSASIRKAWDSRHKSLECPYRLMKRKSTRLGRELIDHAKSVLLSELEESQDVPSFKCGASYFALTHKYIVEESLASSLSVLAKLAHVTEVARKYMDSLDGQSIELVCAEISNYSPDDSLEELGQKCPVLMDYTERAVTMMKPPVELLKRVTVCDTVIAGYDVKRTTEVWIPTWTSRDLVFGKGIYACKGEVLTKLVTASFIQYLAKRKGSVVS
jgi:hypothetical protein